MVFFSSLSNSPMFNRSGTSLTPEQTQMYAAEKLYNFREIATLVSTRSSHTLTNLDLVPDELSKELAEIGQFAEVVYGAQSLPLEFIFDNLDSLTHQSFPLEGYDSLPGSILLNTIKGTIANLVALVAHRPSHKQLVVSITGTVNLSQIFYDLHAIKCHPPSFPNSRCQVHAGFWRMYNGARDQLIKAIEDGLKSHDVDELVLTGHSMGGTMTYFLALDLLVGEHQLPSPPRIKLAAFGAARCGNRYMSDYFRETVAKHHALHGQDSFCEYLVKGFNDGVPSLPPTYFGYRHISQHPLFYIHGNLFRIPPSETECGYFPVEFDTESGERLYPRGGHNYYNRRDMERAARRLGFLMKVLSTSKDGWQERYQVFREKHER